MFTSSSERELNSALLDKIMSIIINKYFYSWSPHVKKAKTVLDSGFHAMDSEFQVLESWFFVSRTWILDTNP